MGFSFPFLRAKDLRTYLLIMRTRSFYSHMHREYIRKVSVHLVQKQFPHDFSNDIISYSKQKKRNLMKKKPKRDSD